MKASLLSETSAIWLSGYFAALACVAMDEKQWWYFLLMAALALLVGPLAMKQEQKNERNTEATKQSTPR